MKTITQQFESFVKQAAAQTHAVFKKNPHTLLCIVGQTATGKSDFVVALATELHGAVLSIDSRQIYTGLDIGSGKVPLNAQQQYQGVIHYGINIAEPSKTVSVVDFQNYARTIITKLQSQNIPIVICGGTGYWIDAVVCNWKFPEFNTAKQTASVQRSLPEAVRRLQQLDPARAAAIDLVNPHRVFRSLQIVEATGKPLQPLHTNPFPAIWFGLRWPKEQLHARIQIRLNERLAAGMLNEIQFLHQSGLSWPALEAFGLEYKFGALFLQGLLSETEFNTQLLRAIQQYSKRQATWFKRNKNIVWFDFQ